MNELYRAHPQGLVWLAPAALARQSRWKPLGVCNGVSGVKAPMIKLRLVAAVGGVLMLGLGGSVTAAASAGAPGHAGRGAARRAR